MGKRKRQKRMLSSKIFIQPIWGFWNLIDPITQIHYEYIDGSF